MKWLKNLEDFKEHIFSNKERAAKRHLNSKVTVKPRQLYDEACLNIAEKLKPNGFQYFPSQHKLKLNSPDKTYTLTIRFSSNRDNVAGHYVELTAYFSITSKKIKKFSKANPLLDYWNDYLIGRDFYTLINEKGGNVVWNLADLKDYNDAITEIPKATKNALLEIFEHIQNEKLVIKELYNNKFEFDNPVSTTQYLLMVDERSIAEKYLSDFLKRPPKKIVMDYKKAKKEFKDNGLPNEFIHGKGFGHEIALLEIQYNLNITVSNNL